MSQTAPSIVQQTVALSFVFISPTEDNIAFACDPVLLLAQLCSCQSTYQFLSSGCLQCVLLCADTDTHTLADPSDVSLAENWELNSRWPPGLHGIQNTVGCLPMSQSWFQRNREARAGVGRKKIQKVIYRPKQSSGTGGPNLAFSCQRTVFA